MSTKARVEFDPGRFGVRIALGEAISETQTQVYIWPTPIVRTIDPVEQLADDAFLRLDEDAARALYEGLAGYFGGTGHDTRALRKDYDAERKRVDVFIAHLTSVGR